jgi:hypothetical protein
VNGRLVRTLVDGPRPAGLNVVAPGIDATTAGDRAAPGLYFFAAIRSGDVRLARRVSVTD